MKINSKIEGVRNLFELKNNSIFQNGRLFICSTVINQTRSMLGSAKYLLSFNDTDRRRWCIWPRGTIRHSCTVPNLFQDYVLVFGCDPFSFFVVSIFAAIIFSFGFHLLRVETVPSWILKILIPYSTLIYLQRLRLRLKPNLWWCTWYPFVSVISLVSLLSCHCFNTPVGGCSLAPRPTDDYSQLSFEYSTRPKEGRRKKKRQRKERKGNIRY